MNALGVVSSDARSHVRMSALGRTGASGATPGMKPGETGMRYWSANDAIRSRLVSARAVLVAMVWNASGSGYATSAAAPQSLSPMAVRATGACITT
ncbi:MAG: hypothetical protein CMQ24_11365 [Gammaproteobacteria bacterium]|nr:hypothetical protein [Gammaproteobacteria bacterium]